MSMDDAEEVDRPRKIVIPYTPRKHFMRLHGSKKRFKFVCAHRRAGKTVSEFNELLRGALRNTRAFPPPRYGYVGPSYAQAKDLVWGYAKYYGAAVTTSFSESELSVRLFNNATITLYGGTAAYERMRGLYFDGIVLDEYPLLNPTVFSTIVRPCLADYRGWAVVSGTSNGDDHFHELHQRALQDPDSWEVIIIPVTDTDALAPEEVEEMTKDMSPEEYAREMLCSFDAPIEGAYYASQLNELQAKGRIAGVPYDPRARVFTVWDLGIHDYMCIWFLQFVGREIHVIDYLQFSGKGLPEAAKILQEKGYHYGGHMFPPDIKARELGTGTSRFEVANSLFGDGMVHDCHEHRVEDGINAVRSMLPLCWFDKEKTAEGVSALRNYHRSKLGKPVHNWASHGADAFRTGAVGMSELQHMAGGGITKQISQLLKRRRRGRV